MSFCSRICKKVLRQNIREYGMYIALFVIMAIFTVTTKGIFISSRNISNLINQTGYIAVLAVGMTLVIVIRHIDLSVGFLAGFLGAVAAIAMVILASAGLCGHPPGAGAGRSGGPDHGFPGGAAGNSVLCGLAGRLVDLPRRAPAGHREHRHDHYPG